MKLAILHISDLHFRKAPDKNPILDRPGKIAAALRGLSEPELEACFVAVTGDIAFSGKGDEYAVALEFFTDLKEELAEFRIASNGFIFIPGNHDCDFDDPNTIRDAIIRDTIRRQNGIIKVDSSMATKCLEVQDNYSDFVSIFSSTTKECQSSIYVSRKYKVNNTEVIFHCYNTAWMSEIHEKQGQLYFPTHLIEPDDRNDTAVTITLLHHPFRWFESENARVLARHVEDRADIILTGHEHTHARYEKVAFDGYTNQFIEGAIMQDIDGSNSGFSAILIDLATMKQQNAEWSWSGSRYLPVREPRWIPFGQSRRASFITNTSTYAKHLRDIGTAFTHPRVEAIDLQELFIYPDLTCLTERTKASGKLKAGNEVVSSRTLAENPPQRALILGSERSGKSTLAKALYLACRGNRMSPLMLSGDLIRNGHKVESLKRLVRNAIKEQYGSDNVEEYLQLPSDEKVLIVDDMQDAKINQAGQAALISNLRQRFGNLFIFAHDSFFMSGLTHTRPESDGFIGFSIFKIRELGNRLRGALIDRWMELGTDYTGDDREEALQVELLERQVRALLGKNLIPSYPLFVLTILQTHESTKPHRTASGSYGYYYEALITAAIHDRSASIPHDTVYTFVGILAFTMFNSRISTLSAVKFEQLLTIYQKRHKVRPGLEPLRRMLEESRIFVWDDLGNGRFQYRYIYFYFVARYLADNIHRDQESELIRSTVTRMVNKLHVEENANIVIFFLYLTKDETSIMSLVDRAKSLYSDAKPCDFSGDIEFTSDLITERPKMILEDGDSRSHKERHREDMDRSIEEKDENEDDQIEGVIRINEALKTLQVMGQVLRNFPGSLEGDMKVDIAKQSYLLGLRMLGYVCKLVDSNLEELRLAFRQMLIGEGVVSEEDAKDEADFLIYRILSAIGFGMIKRISHSVGSEYLKETFEEVEDDDVPRSIALINVSMKLDHFSSFPQNEIVDLYDEVHDNVFTTSIVQGLVVEHLYLFPISQSLRQQVCDHLRIEVRDQKLITGEDRK